MTLKQRNRKFGRFAIPAAFALGLIAVSVPMTPAKAFVGVDIGGVAVGVGNPYYGPGPYYRSYGYYGPYGYYAPGPYYPYPW